MPEEIVTQDQWGQVIFYDDWNSLELRWLPSTANAEADDIKSLMKVFASVAVERRPKTMIVDTTQFGFMWGEDMEAWRGKVLIPRYNESGVTKFAFIANPNFPGDTVESGAAPECEGAMKFPTGWFKSRERAYEWLAS